MSNFDCPDPLSVKYPEDMNAPHYCKVCDSWQRRARFSKKYAKENVCRNCAKGYCEHQKEVTKALWEAYDSHN